VNKYTIYWEYFKMFVAKENIFFGKFRRLVEKWDPESPILRRIIQPYFTDGLKYTYKQAGRRIFVGFYLPIILTALLICYVLWRMLVNFLCKRKTMANLHGVAPSQKSNREKID
jgi:hypothetical protein